MIFSLFIPQTFIEGLIEDKWNSIFNQINRVHERNNSYAQSKFEELEENISEIKDSIDTLETEILTGDHEDID